LDKSALIDRAERAKDRYLSHSQRLEVMISLSLTLPGRKRPCRMLLTFAMLKAKRGRSSVVEHQLPKLSVVGSIPIARSNV
jgi:hypothetical protein